jgi:hypothetical protein
LVGYDNRNRVWLARNSWSAAFADGGYFRIGFGVSGIASPTGTYGLRFLPSTPPQRVPPDLVVASAAHPGCLEYKAQAWDRIDGVARTFGVPLQRLLADNLASLGPTLSARPAGKSLLVCGAEEAAAELLPPRSQLEALLQIKAAIDKKNILFFWTAKTGAGGRYCSWPGVKCDNAGDVTELNPQAKDGPPETWHDGPELGGVLPSGVALRGLPKLSLLKLSSKGLSGTLPADWGLMQKPPRFELSHNQLAGTLPAGWSRMTKLFSLALSNNTLTGTLPPEWSAMGLYSLDLGLNLLTGTIPAAWADLHLSDINLSRNYLNGTLPANWGRLDPLVVFHIDLSDNALSGTLPKQWASLTSLFTLALSLNRLTGPLPPEWAAMDGIVEFSAEENRLSGPLPAAWAAWSEVEMIRLSSNALTGPLPPAWSAMRRLRRLAVEDNTLSGTVPPSWGPLPLRTAGLKGNPGLMGCLPRAWQGKVEAPTPASAAHTAAPPRPTAQIQGTRITGYC